jgi:hypothetical protein
MLLRVLALVLATSSLAFAQEQRRDLSDYDVIGPYKIMKIVSGPDTDRLEGQIRDFLWTHWRQRRRGAVVATHQYVEGAVRTSYFVEPDPQGHWAVVEHTDYPFLPRTAPKQFSCSKLERVEPDRLHLPLIPIADSEQRLPEAYLLHPVCSKGKLPKLW